MKKVRMVAFQTHTRGDGLLKRGDEFEVTEEEAHAYAARKNPLAGRLDSEETPAQARANARTAAEEAQAEEQEAAAKEAGTTEGAEGEKTAPVRRAPTRATPRAAASKKATKKK